MVLDFGEQGEVVGIEVINLSIQARIGGHRFIERATGSNTVLRCSYDAEADSLYLKLKAARSVDQKAL
jgi:uncharacterized protein YuzE